MNDPPASNSYWYRALARSLGKQWFLVGLTVLITLGLLAGKLLDSQIAADAADAVPSRLLTAVILFLMAFTLNSASLVRALRSPGPVLWCCGVNYVFLPLLGWALAPLQFARDFSAGLMIAVCVPCTMAAASVWTRKAGGNDAVSLLTTLVTNALCFVVTPFWLAVLAETQAEFDTTEMIRRLIEAVLVPIILGQLVRLWPRAATFATQHKTPLGVIAQSLILVLVFSAALRAGAQLQAEQSAPGGMALLVLALTCFGAHVAAMWLAWVGGRQLGFQRDDLKACAFAGSQKTLPVGVYLANSPAFVVYPFAVLAILLYHATQLFFDTYIAQLLVKSPTKPPTTADN